MGQSTYHVRRAYLTHNNGKILDMESHVQEITGPKKGLDERTVVCGTIQFLVRQAWSQNDNTTARVRPLSDFEYDLRFISSHSLLEQPNRAWLSTARSLLPKSGLKKPSRKCTNGDGMAC